MKDKMLAQTEKLEINEVINKVNDLLQKTKNGTFADMLSMKIKNLEALKDTLEKLNQPNATVNINHAFEMENVLGTPKITCLNIAVTYCDPGTIDYLFRAGAKADNETIHHATKTLWTNSNKTLDVLVANGVDINAPKDGHTALYNVKREDSKHGQMKPVVNSLVNHHATMFTSERLAEPILRTKDKIENTYNSIVGFMPFPR